MRKSTLGLAGRYRRTHAADVDAGGAVVRAHSRQLATVVTVAGTIDESNADEISVRVRRFVLGDRAMVLDLSSLSRCDVKLVSLLYAVEVDCHAAGIEWAVVIGDADASVVDDVFDHSLPIAETVATALQHFAETIDARRRLLPLLRRSA